MKDLIKRNLKGRTILVLFIATSIIYIVMLTITIPKVMSMAGGLKLLDMMPTGYNHDYVNTLLHALGENGRSAYLYNQIPLDMLYPFLFGVTYCLLLAYILKRMGKLDSNMFYLSIIPLASGAMDYAENFGIISILNKYPANTVLLTQVTNAFSVTKSVLTTIYFIILITAIIALGIKFITSKKTFSH